MKHHLGEFRYCAGCGDWLLWTPLHHTGPVYCCDACAQGRRCECAGSPVGSSRRAARVFQKGGEGHARQPVTPR